MNVVPKTTLSGSSTLPFARGSSLISVPSSCGLPFGRVFGRIAAISDESGNQNSGEGFGEGVDIDILAKRLSEEAQKLRRQQAGASSSLDMSTAEGLEYPNLSLGRSKEGSENTTDGPFTFQSKTTEAEVLADVGDGGFCADDFELLQQLGYLSIQQVTRESLLGSSVPLGSKEMSAVIMFAARYYSGAPYEFPVTTMLKEYLPGAKLVAGNELQVLQHLCGIPEHKWKVASAPVSPDPPVVPLLGYFISTQSEAALDQCPESNGTSIWLVYKWERLRPLSNYWEAEKPRSNVGWPWENAAEAATRARRNMLRAIFRGVLSALSFCHERKVIHGSLGSGSVLLSSFDDRDADSLVVKLDNFGFSQRLVTPGISSADGGSSFAPPPRILDHEDDPIALGRQQDIQAVGRLFLETVILALVKNETECNVSRESIERLIMEVFPNDFDGLRRYCSEEPDWDQAVALLSERGGAGWELLRKLLDGSMPAAQLLNESFLEG